MSDRYLTARGYLQKAEREMLYRLAGLVPAYGSILNVGIEYGASMVCLTDGSLPSVSVTGVDISLARYEGPKYPNRNFYLVESRSEDLLQVWNHSIDLLFVDGDHTREGVIKDIGWIKFLKVGGYVAFHDCSDYGSCDPNKPHHICPEVDEEVQVWYDHNIDSFVEVERACTIRTFRRVV